jgi:UDP-N-acetylglucosamine:LPS N-acetylglucosamine transferase
VCLKQSKKSDENANELIKNGKKIIWVGAVRGIENEIIPKHDIILEVINISTQIKM